VKVTSQTGEKRKISFYKLVATSRAFHERKAKVPEVEEKLSLYLKMTVFWDVAPCTLVEVY
jgi:hypothetical protein